MSEAQTSQAPQNSNITAVQDFSVDFVLRLMRLTSCKRNIAIKIRDFVTQNLFPCSSSTSQQLGGKQTSPASPTNP